MNTTFWNLIEIFSRCGSEDELRKTAKFQFDNLGISGVTWSVGTFSPQSREYFTTVDRKLVDEWHDQIDVDPRVSSMWPRMQRRDLMPKLWGAAVDDGEPRSPAFREYCEMLAGHGYTSSVSIPIWRQHPSEHEIVTYSTSMTSPEFGEFVRWSIPLITASASLLSIQIAALRSHQESSAALTAREVECLLWLASGLRHDRIADRLGISEWTVMFHLRNARAKLDAGTNEQAVAKAIISGLISP
jgi:DNA-binding CsgD family transcriptional regulator